MAGMTMAFFPRFTTLAGSGGGVAYASEVFDVTSYNVLAVPVLLVVCTQSGTVTAVLQQSSDLNEWTDIASPVTLTAGTLENLGVTSPDRYVRVLVTITGANAVATLWAKGVGREQ